MNSHEPVSACDASQQDFLARLLSFYPILSLEHGPPLGIDAMIHGRLRAGLA
jgi:hypothetical protein